MDEPTQYSIEKLPPSARPLLGLKSFPKGVEIQAYAAIHENTVNHYQVAERTLHTWKRMH
jgi:hypothetical protein